MKLDKRRIIAQILIIVMLFSIFPVEQTKAEPVVIGYQGYIPGRGIPGPGGVVGVATPGFAVSLVHETLTPPNVLQPKLFEDQVIAKFVDHFKNKYPSQTDSIFFIPSGNYIKDSAMGWYDHSSGYLKFAKASDQDQKLRPMGGTLNTNLNYSNFYSAISAEGKLIKDLGAGKWQTLMTASEGETKALKIWSYFLQNNAIDLNENIQKFLKSNIIASDSDKIKRKKAACAWLDLVSTLWLLSPTNQRLVYEQEIERFLKNADIDGELYEKPPLIAISTVVRLSAPNFSSKPIYLKSTDYAQYLYGASGAASLHSSAWHDASPYNRNYVTYSGAQPGWRQLIADSANKSMKDIPNRDRKTSLTGEAASNDAFNWGMGAIFSRRLGTSTGSAVWTNSSADGAIALLNFSGGMYGYALVAPYEFLKYPPPLEGRGRFGIRTDPPPRVVVEQTSPVIGQKVGVSLEIKQQSADLTIWQGILTGTLEPGYPKIQIDLKRVAPSAAQLTTSSTLKGDNVARTIDKATLLRMMEGKESDILYWDDTTNYAIAKGQTIEFKYKAAVTIHLNATTSVVLTGDPDEAKKTFYRGEDPIGIITEPSYWSEIKNGSPGNEPFEAMAGVPTTRNLYFASGGSEFIVEVELEYVQDTEITRTYRSYFTAVDSEFKKPDTAVMDGQEHKFSEQRDQWSATWGSHLDSKPEHPAANPRTYTWKAKSDGVTRTVTETATWVDTSSPPTHGCPGHTSGDPPSTTYDHCGDASGTASGYWL